MRYRRPPTSSEEEIKKVKKLIEEKKINIKQEEFILMIIEKHLGKLQYQKGLKIGHSF